MKRRDLFKAIASLAAGAVCAPLVGLLPEKKWEGTNVTRRAFEEVTQLEQRVRALSGTTCSYVYFDGTGIKEVGPFSIYRDET